MIFSTSLLNLHFFIAEQLFFCLSALVFIINFVFANLILSKKSIKFLSFINTRFAIAIFFSTVYYYSYFMNEITNFPVIKSIWILNDLTLTYYIDGIAICFILLTTFIFSLCLIQIQKIQNYVYVAILLFMTEIGLLLSFVVTDIFVFYIFFESVLIPMYLLIGIWGSRTRKIKASYYLFLYTLFGSLFLLFAIIYLKILYNTTDIFVLSTKIKLDDQKQLVLWICFFLPFAIKIPMFPFHIWLPEAHVEAPTFGSVILASLLLKLGGYGFIRFTTALLPYANIYFSSYIQCLAVIGVVHASVISVRQMDFKRVIAYASIAHMNLVVLGIYTLNNVYGLEGSLYLMCAHGIVSSGLFLAIGFIYERTHSRYIWYYGGLIKTIPVFVFYFIFFILANMSFPGTSNFVGEFIIFLGLILDNMQLVIPVSSGIVLSAIYSIWLFNRLTFGTLKNKYFNILHITDLTNAEITCLLPLVVLMLSLGISSEIILNLLITN